MLARAARPAAWNRRDRKGQVAPRSGLTPYRGTAASFASMAGLTIGKFAAEDGVSVETMRFYQRRGLHRAAGPARVRIPRVHRGRPVAARLHPPRPPAWLHARGDPRPAGPRGCRSGAVSQVSSEARSTADITKAAEAKLAAVGRPDRRACRAAVQAAAARPGLRARQPRRLRGLAPGRAVPGARAASGRAASGRAAARRPRGRLRPGSELARPSQPVRNQRTNSRGT